MRKRSWREETESEVKDQLYLELKILQSVTGIISFLLLWVVLLISQGANHSSKAKHGLEGWKPPLRFCLLPSLCSNESHQEGSFRVYDLFTRYCGLLGRWFAFETAVHCWLASGLRAVHLRLHVGGIPLSDRESEQLIPMFCEMLIFSKKCHCPERRCSSSELVKKPKLDSIIFIYVVYA